MTPERIEENKLKKGDRVVMHTCIESEEEPGKIWTCKTDQFTRGKGVFAQDSVFLEGYSGSFAPEFLQKVVLPSEDERVLAALEESQQQMDAYKEEYFRENAEKVRNKRLLVEAQQTIARQRESLEFLADDDNWSWWGEGEDETVTWVGGTDPQHAAREVLGNKEGTTVPVTPNCPTCGNQHPIAHPSIPGVWLCVPEDYVFEEGSDKA
ncbi:MAG TPA: hypothetical protein VGI33_07355 [Paenibacillus sp.]|jgi:hypothetical protein